MDSKQLRRSDAPLPYFPPPPLEALDSILPSEPLLLMGAGPVPIPHAVARANGVVINHLGETMEHVIVNLQAMARYAFQTKTERIMGVAGPASAAMEMAVTNLLWRGRRCLCLNTGTFSHRLGEMAVGVGADVTFIEPETG
jgi:aspartate aminotransferase-like enzyme